MTAVFGPTEVGALEIAWRPDAAHRFVIRDADELREFTREVADHRPPPPIGLTDLVRAIAVTATGGLADVIIDAGPNLMVAIGEAITLEGATRGGLEPVTFTWSGVDLSTGASAPPAQSAILTPEAIPANDTLYSVTATDQTGRSRSDSTTVYGVDFAGEMLLAYSFCSSSVVTDSVRFEGNAITVRLFQDPSFVGVPCFPAPSFNVRVLRLPLGFPIQFYDTSGELIVDASDPLLRAEITPDSSAGSVQAVYLSGRRVQLTAVPADGFQFQRWEGPVTGGDNPIIAQAQSDEAVVAVFADGNEE